MPPGDAPITVRLKDLIDVTVFQDLLDSFKHLTGVGTAVLDLEGNILIASGWQEICIEFHRKHPVTASRCRESDTILANQLAEGNKYNIYKCKNGMVDVAAPILIDGMHLGNLYTGQFFLSRPDPDFFAGQAETFGFDSGPYLQALSKVPILSRDEVKKNMQFLTNLTVIIGNSGMDRKNLFDSNKNLEGLVQEKTAELKASHIFLESIFNAIQDGISVLDNELNVVRANRIMHQWYPDLKNAMGKKCHEIYHGKNKACENCPSIKALETGEMASGQVLFTGEDGRPGTLELFSFPIMGDTGDITGVVEYVRDISQRVEAEKEKEDLIRQLKESISQIKHLSGLLPMCSVCKKIRDDQGYWNQVESYIQTHSEAAVSHGMCPDCSEKLYGREKWYIKMKASRDKET